MSLTHSYLGTMPCGCSVCIVVDAPDDKKWVEKEVASMVRRGMTIERLPSKDAVARLTMRCPHQPQQGTLAGTGKARPAGGEAKETSDAV